MSNHPDYENKNRFLLGQPDALSALFSRLDLRSEIYVDGDFCGTWAVDTSGSKRIPFHLIGRGQAWLHTEQGQAQVLSPGDLVIFPKDAFHIISNSELPPEQSIINKVPTLTLGEPITNMVCGFFEFKNKTTWPLLNNLSEVIHLDLGTCSSYPVIKTYIDLILSELRQRQPGYFAVVNQIALLLFVEVMRQQLNSGKIESGLLAALFDTRISKALQGIHHRPQQNWSVEDLANEAGMSRSAFSQKFTQLVGTPAMQYLAAWRMQEAKKLLETTVHSTATIAEQCGYESEAAFRKAFKKIMGLNPGEVRKNASLLSPK